VDPTNTSFLQLLAPAVVVGLLIYFTYLFYNHYYKPSQALQKNIEHMASTLASMKEGDADIRKNGASRVFSRTVFENIWSEFAKTLHVQIVETENGKEKRARLTIPARAYFNVSTVVETPLKVQYFKHLPGILTGVGIIGTFAGLLFGLSNFDSSSPETMAKSVNLLLSGVRDAFYASTLAITLAMLITHLEKLQYRKCVSALEEMTVVIDSLFDGGVEEEYLAAIAKQTKSFETQADGFRQAVTESLNLIAQDSRAAQDRLADMIRDAMFEALTESSRKSNAHFEQALARQIKEPLEEMTRKIESRISTSKISNAEISQKIIRASQSTTGTGNSVRQE
jgi:hypothetical protein